MAKILAHRGASAYRPENTLPAFRLAMEQGAHGFELDIHLSSDGEVVVAHDLELERVSDGTGRICDHTLAQLKGFNFNNLFPEQGPCTVPTLGEVYELIAHTGHIVNVELKSIQEAYPQMPEKLIRLEKEYAMEGRVLYSSFNHHSLMEIRKLAPGAEIGLLYELHMVHPWVYAEYVSATAIHPHYYTILAAPETVPECHKRGIAVNVWTVDDAQIIKLLAGYGVDSIITNKPDVV